MIDSLDAGPCTPNNSKSLLFPPHIAKAALFQEPTHARMAYRRNFRFINCRNLVERDLICMRAPNSVRATRQFLHKRPVVSSAVLPPVPVPSRMIFDTRTAVLVVIWRGPRCRE